MKGIAYGVGVGPGDPELMTLKAVRLTKENDIIALPGKNPKESVAYKIAVQAVPELADKELVPIDMPMVKDRDSLCDSHLQGARLIETYLAQGQNVVFLTLGDASIYCTFTYLQAIMEEDGYHTELVNGIPSFCAAAARLNIPISEWNEPIHVIPAVHSLSDDAAFDSTNDPVLSEQLNPSSTPAAHAALPAGTCILMKSGGHLKEVKELLSESGKEVYMVENCGMPNEKLYCGLETIPNIAGYFTLIIAKDKQ